MRPRALTRPPNEGDRALANALLEVGRSPVEWPAHKRAALYDSLSEKVASARARTQMRIAVVACGAAFLAGLWVASRGVQPLPRDASPRTALAAPSAGPATEVLPASRAATPLLAPSADAPGWEIIESTGFGLIEVLGSGPKEVRELPQERQIRIDQGVLRAQIVRQDPTRPLVVVSPQLRVIVVGTRFDVYAEGAVTRVEVLQGHVRVESAAGEVGLSAGEQVRSDDPRLLPAPPPPPPCEVRPRVLVLPMIPSEPARETLDDCDRLRAHDALRACYRRLAQGSSLTAQNAVLSLGRMARDDDDNPDEAIARWREYERRFPLGALAPEVAQQLFEALLRQGRTAEAIGAAADFEARFPDDPRTPRVALARARLLCDEAGERSLGRLLIGRLALSPSPELRAQAAALLEACQGPSLGPAGAGTLVPRDIRPGAPPDG